MAPRPLFNQIVGALDNPNYWIIISIAAFSGLTYPLFFSDSISWVGSSWPLFILAACFGSTSFNSSNENQQKSNNQSDESKSYKQVSPSFEANYREVFTQAGHGILIHDLDGLIVDVNPAAASITGYSINELIGMNISRLLTEKGHQLVLQSQQSLLANPLGSQLFNLEVKRKDGSQCYISLSNHLVDIRPGQIGIEVIFKDVTDRILTREALKESEERYRSLVNNIKMDIVHIDTDFNIKMTNVSRSEVNFKKSGEHLLGKKCFQKFRDRKSVCPDCPCRQAMSSGKPVTLESSIKIHGQLRYVRRQAFPAFGPDGSITGCIEFIDDITEQTQALQALQESEGLSFVLLNKSPHPIIIFNADTSIRYVNPALEKLTGFSAAELINQKPPFPWWAEEDPTQHLREFQKTFLKSAEIREVKIRKKGGGILWVEISTKPVILDRQPKYHLASWVNITQRKKIEDALREANDFNSNILNNAPNPIIVTNLDSSIRYINPALENLTGYSRDELLGMKSPFPWWPEEERQEYLDQNITGARIDLNKQERHFRKKNGEMFWVTLSIKAVKDGDNTKYYLGNWVDITELKKIEMALRETNEFNTSLLNNSPNPIIVFNHDYSIGYVNPAVEKITGFQSSELTGIKAPFPWWPEDNKELNIAVLKQHRHVDKDRLEILIQSKQGEFRWIETCQAIIRDKDGRMRNLLAIWKDITEEKHLRENLQFYIAKITQVQEEERKRIARELHDDTAQALAVLGLDIESISRNLSSSPPEIADKLEALRIKVRQITEDVRRFSHELRPGLLDQLGLLPALDNLAAEISQGGGIQADVEVSGDERRLSAEKELLLFRIVQESLNNIRKHAQATAAKVRIKFMPSGVRLIIIDNGRGFDVNNVMSELASRGRMGLIGMQERVRLLGGRLAIRSVAAKGTAIIVSIPDTAEVVNYLKSKI